MGTFGKLKQWINQELASGDAPAKPNAGPLPPSQPALAGAATAMPDAQEVIRVVGWMLRTFGEESFDLETGTEQEQRAGWDHWAGHVETAPKRDWTGLKKFVGTQRKVESEFVTHNVKALRETLWDLLQRLGRSVALDALDDGTMGEQLQNLRVVVEEKPVDEIRREVLKTVESIGKMMRDRQARVKREMEAAVNQLGSVRKELSQTRTEMAKDGLTRLYNRASFDEHLQAMTALGNLTGEPCSLLMVDIDHFKVVNDRLGHQAGDEVLRQVADTLARTYPRRTDFVARYGGEEFAVILPDTRAAELGPMAARAVEALREKRIVVGEEDLAVTISVGAAMLRRGEAPKEWLGRADKALYATKNSGRNSARVG
jgi:diguanylate cyclase (GGDEF)-like protein